MTVLDNSDSEIKAVKSKAPIFQDVLDLTLG